MVERTDRVYIVALGSEDCDGTNAGQGQAGTSGVCWPTAFSHCEGGLHGSQYKAKGRETLMPPARHPTMCVYACGCATNASEGCAHNNNDTNNKILPVI